MSGPRGAVLPPKNVQAVTTVAGEERRELFAGHLERILASPVFRNSKRYAAVLRYVVETTLEGSPDKLKERTIGVDVFGRAADYDTSSDHAVRSAMGEVRKRLAQYYQEEGKDSDLRIEIQPGSYVPQFRIATPEPTEPDTQFVDSGIPPIPIPAGSSRARIWYAAAAGAVVLGAALILAVRILESAGPVAAFWGPLFASPSPILVCIGNLEGGNPAEAAAYVAATGGPLTMRLYHRLPSQTVHIADATTLARLAGFLGSQKRSYRIATQSEADFRDLQNGPAILIGLLNNDWTTRLMGKLRFTVERPAPGKVVIRDREQPSRSEWSMDYLTPMAEITRDYAIILRALDPKTDQMVVMAGGISVFGTIAAGEFLTSERDLQELAAQSPAGWRQRNVEVILTTEVIRGKSGRPKIIATHFW